MMLKFGVSDPSSDNGFAVKQSKVISDAPEGPSHADSDNLNSEKDLKDKVSNNNTASYIPSAGRLKFFKEGKCLLELTHRGLGGNHEGRSATGTWVPIAKKVYWPPQATANTMNIKSENSGQSASETGSDIDGSSSAVSSPMWPPKKRVRKNVRPLKCKNTRHPELSFAMKPPPCIASLRKKIRGLNRKRRTPYIPIVVGTFLMRIESQTVKTRAKRKPFVNDRIRKSSRLESVISKLNNKTLIRKKTPSVNISIGTWGSSNKKKTTKSSSTSAAPPAPAQPLMKIKSELCPVTETCTAASMPNTSSKYQSPSSCSPATKIKAPLKSVMVESRSLNMGTSSSPKTLPITPTLARIKPETSTLLHSSSLMTPDMKRVKVEISGSPRMPVTSPSSPDRMFTSPRKRYNKDQYDGSPSTKRHRLSTDSLGSSSGRGEGSNSPLLAQMIQSPPRHPNNRNSSFSIDSIISNKDIDASGRILKPTAIPASPARISDLKREFSSDNDAASHGSRTPTPVQRPRSPPHTPTISSVNTPHQPPTTPLVSITPFAARGANSSADPRIDPRLAHLAGLAADPRLGLTPTGGANPFLMNPYSPYLANNPFLQAAAAQAQVAQAAAMAAAVQHQQNSQIAAAAAAAASRLNWPPSKTPTSRPSPPSSIPPMPSSPHRSSSSGSATTATSPALGLWQASQYQRSEPKVEQMRSQSPDTPLNLSMK